MTKQQQLTIIESYTKQRHGLLTNKGDDYNGSDVLGLFKTIATSHGIEPSQVVLMEIHKKVLRLTNLMGKKSEPNNESILDSVTDLSNYTDLLRCTLHKESAPCCLQDTQATKGTIKYAQEPEAKTIN